MTDPNPPGQPDEQQDEKWYEKTPYQIILFVVGIALFGLVLGLILDWYIDPRTSTAKKDIVQALGLITAGVAGAVGIYFTWRSQRLSRQAQEENQRNTLAQIKNAEEQLRLSRQSQEDNQRNTQEQLDITRQGQITERFTRAIEQLGETHDNGDPKLELRLGGIYALERIARDSPKRDSSTVMEVLTAYVRENASSLPPKESPPPADILAIVDVLRRAKDYIPEEYRIHYDLRRTHLIRVDLREADLREAALQEANLQEANLYLANLQQADLREANLQAAILQAAKGLTQEQLEHSLGDVDTELPEDLEMPKWWTQDNGKQTEGNEQA